MSDVPPPPSPTSGRAWRVTRQALVTTGSASKTAAIWLARRTAAVYHAIDPDVRQSVADLPLAATTMLGARKRDIEALPDDGHAPIVCIHGLSGHRQNFFPLRGLLYLHGRRRVYSIGYDDAAPLEESARTLARVVEEIVAANDLGEETRIDLVAHSMGGIVARLAAFDPAFRRRIRHLVTLGTPHRGTLAARFMATPRTLDLRPDSALFARLDSQLPWPGPPSSPRFTAFWSQSDVFMLPASTATLPGADNRELSNMSHTGYLTRPSALIAIREALG